MLGYRGIVSYSFYKLELPNIFAMEFSSYTKSLVILKDYRPKTKEAGFIILYTLQSFYIHSIHEDGFLLFLGLRLNSLG